MQDSAPDLAEQGHEARARALHDRLVPALHLAVAGANVHVHHGEEARRCRPNGVRIDAPAREAGERQALDAQSVALLLVAEPREDAVRRLACAVVARVQGVHERGVEIRRSVARLAQRLVLVEEGHGHAGEHRAAVGVHRVIETQELEELAQGEPPEGIVVRKTLPAGSATTRLRLRLRRKREPCSDWS